MTADLFQYLQLCYNPLFLASHLVLAPSNGTKEAALPRGRRMIFKMSFPFTKYY